MSLRILGHASCTGIHHTRIIGGKPHSSDLLAVSGIVLLVQTDGVINYKKLNTIYKNNRILLIKNNVNSRG